jgi:beta-xylosidase
LSAFTGIDLKRRVEPGEIVLTAAASAADAGLTTTVTLTGAVRHVGHDRVWDAPVCISEL